jgi:hypothetical protein
MSRMLSASLFSHDLRANAQTCLHCYRFFHHLWRL